MKFLHLHPVAVLLIIVFFALSLFTMIAYWMVG